MKNVRETCLQFFQNEDIKRDVKEIIRPIVGIMYNEFYPYLLFLCIYNVFLIFIVLANLILLVHLLRPKQKVQDS
jgi:hypothetical protein